MSIFGDETITPPNSPETGQEDQGGAVETEGQEEFEQESQYQEEQETEEQQGQEPDSNPEGADPEEGQSEESGDGDDQQEDGKILGKFKSVDDLVKGYKNLERQFHQSRSNPGHQGQKEPTAWQQMQQTQPQQQIPPGQQNPSQEFWNLFQQDPLGTMQYLIDTAVQQQTAPIQEARQMDSLAKNLDPVAREFPQIRSEEGMNELFQRVNDIAQELGNPQLAQYPTGRMLRLAATELWGESRQQQYDRAKAQGRQEAEEARRQKQSVKTSTKQKTKKPNDDQPKTPEDEIKAAILQAGRGGGIFG